MTTVTDLTTLTPRVASDPHEIDRLRWFQMNRYFEAGLLDELPTELPDDPCVERSTYFGIYQGSEIHATARIVQGSHCLPMLEHHTLHPQAMSELETCEGKVAEVSRLAVGREAPHHRALLLLSREFLHFGLRNPAASILLASVERPLVRILNRILGVPLQIIGPTIEKYGAYNGQCVPIKIDTLECLHNFQRQRGRRWEFFMHDAVIDLTDAMPSRIDLAETAQVAS